MDHLLLTRRQTLQSLAYSAVLGGPLLSLVGCGGGGGHHGGGSSSTDSANVAVQLPSGFAIPATDLVGGTAYGTGAMANGSFKAKVSSSGPTFAYVQQKSTGKTVLFGLVGPGRPGVTPLATAALMLAVALGITGLPGANLAQALGLLEANESVQALGTAIATAMASDPYAANGTNDAVKAALKTAYAAFSGTAAPAIARPKASDASLLLVSPTGEQGGFRIDQVEDGKITPTNLKRRPAIAYSYLVGHATADATVDVSPATRIDSQEILATATLLESIASLGVQGAYGPRAGKAVALPVSSGDVKTLYSTVVLMASTDQGAEPTFFADAHYANEAAEWRQKRKDLNAAGFVGIIRDVFAPVVAGGTSLAVSEASALLASFTATVAAANQANLLAAAQAGQYGELAQFTVGEIGVGGYTEAEAVSFIAKCLGIAPSPGPTVASALLAYAAVAAATLAAATAALALADIAASYYDVVSSPQGEIWTETAIKPSVAISPSSGTVQAGGSVALTVGTPGVSSTLYKFHWTLSSGGNGNIGDPSGTGGAGRDITTTGTSINLLTASSDTEGTVYTVTVEALELKTGASLGKAKATLTIGKLDATQTGTFFVTSGTNPADSVPGAGAAYAYVKFNLVPGATTYTLRVDDPKWPFQQQTKFTYASLLPTKTLDGTVVGNAILIQLDQTRPEGSDQDGDFTTAQAIADLTQQFSGFTYRVEAT